MVNVSKVSVARRLRVDCCHRCGGLMVPEQVHELGAYEWRCIGCGERIDPVILEHRQQEFARIETERGSAGRGKSRLS